MDEDVKAALSALSQAIHDQSQAIILMNSNMAAMYLNVRRLSDRLAIHEAVAALDQMDEGRALQ